MILRAPRSMQGRLFALSLLATLVALLIAAWGIAGVLERFVIAGIDQRLDAEIALLASAVDGNGDIDRARIEARRGVLQSGGGWRWRIETPRGAMGSADLPTLPDGPPGPPGLHGPREDQRDGPDVMGGPDREPRAIDGQTEQGVRLHARRYTIVTGSGPVTITAAAPRRVIARPIRDAIVPLLIVLAMLGIVLTVAAWVQLRLGLRPLRQLRDAVAAIRAGRVDRVDEDQPTELQPLAAELNALAADNEAALASARMAAANLAHALKTPVATLALAVRDDPDRARQVARIDATIRHHLGRARDGHAGTRVATPLAPAVAALVHVVERLHADRHVTIDAAIPADLAVRLDAHDLDEIVGNLIDNAARHAESAVRIVAAREDRVVRLSVIDDGPGIAAADRQRATDPGVRLDERGDGHGFGLAIVRDLVALHGGTLSLDAATGGGLVVTVNLPAALS
ncbi:histidine kinase [Sphingomonas sp. Leaf339]|uniref:sensor histidine kinase n=1 Tax=Sphingomonas sp. Leaf339 TaxID=1736343 RepID=UPI0006FDD762|nr:HAMP domain-containing sensor histidine kinase [Sphingomonas sp. Leaf339]KQU53132.1 histidine kinase [Sphingomonas sp. Leaf339]